MNIAFETTFDGNAVGVQFADSGPVRLNHDRIRCDSPVDMTGQFHETWHSEIAGQLCPGGEMRAPAI